MSKHTPGPWTNDLETPWILSSDGSAVAQICSRPLREANAHLIAAAPELLGALRFILAFYEPGQRHLDTEAWKKAEASARRVVAKAEGRS